MGLPTGGIVGRPMTPEASSNNRMLLERVPAITYIEEGGSGGPWAGRMTYISAEVNAILGYTPQELLTDAKLWESLIHPDDLPAAIREDWRTSKTGNRFNAQYRMIARDGRVVWIHDVARPVVDPVTGLRSWHGLMLDVTAAKAAEEHLRETEERYRTLVEQIPAVTYVDAVPENDPVDLRPVFISSQLEMMLGYTPGEWTADPDLWTRVVHPEDVDFVSKAGEQAFSTGRPLSVEYRMVARDGRIVWVREEASLVRDSDGRPKLWQGVYVDITELKRAEEEQSRALEREREAAERLRTLDEMKNTFLQAVSHDLRTPLTAILGLAVTLGSEDVKVDEAQVRDLAGRIESNARKLHRLVTDLLDLDRLSRGIVEPRLRETDVGALVRNLLTEPGLPGHDVIVDADPMLALVDAAWIERIVENLLVNAMRHTPPTTRVWVKVKSHPEGVLIAVEDDGPGVPEELRDVIFEPFHQGLAASDASPGIGVGLTLVARFAELHRGRAWVEEREGGGASFRVVLPASRH